MWCRSALLLLMAAVADGFVSCGLPVPMQRGGMLCRATNRGAASMASQHTQQPTPPSLQTVSRRFAILFASTSAAALPLVRPPAPAFAADASKGLVFEKTPSGLQFADAKVGSGTTIKVGDKCTIDYVMSTSGARYGSKIYSTKEVEQPYRWVIGDGKTIIGLEQAVIGGDGIPPMLPGGVRRVIIPSSLGYEVLAKPLPGMQFQDCQEGSGPGPIPPELTGKGEGAYQRFKNIYCNANRPYQPDVVLDIKLYGKRGETAAKKAEEEEEEE